MTLRKADGAQLGLDVKPLDGPKDRSAWGGRGARGARVVVIKWLLATSSVLAPSSDALCY